MPETNYGYDKTDQLIDEASDAMKRGKESASEAAKTLKDKTQDLGRAAMDKVESNRVAAAGALHNAASSLHDNAGKMPNGPQIAHSAAERVEAMAGYLQSNDTKQMMDDVGQVVKRNPMPSLVIAACVGFLVGRAVRSS